MPLLGAEEPPVGETPVAEGTGARDVAPVAEGTGATDVARARTGRAAKRIVWNCILKVVCLKKAEKLKVGGGGDGGV